MSIKSQVNSARLLERKGQDSALVFKAVKTICLNHYALLPHSYHCSGKYNYLLLQSEPTHLEELPRMAEYVHVLLKLGAAMPMPEGLLHLLNWILQGSGQNSVSEG